METALELDIEANLAFRKSVSELSEYELERGKPMPTQQHSLTQMNLSAALKVRYQRKFVIFPELTIELGDKTAVPDISVYPYYAIEWGAEDPAAVAEPPLLAVEIISPSQTLREINKKVQKYFAQGIKSCWIVQPELQIVSVLHPGAKPQTFSTGLVRDDVVGIEVPLEEVFE